MSKGLEEEFFAPRGEFHFSGERSFIGMGVEDVERHAPDEGKVLRCMVLARAGVVFVKDDLKPRQLGVPASDSYYLQGDIFGGKDKIDAAARYCALRHIGLPGGVELLRNGDAPDILYAA